MSHAPTNFERPPSKLERVLGGSCGDALGAPVEFMSLREIHQQFGPQGIREFSPVYYRVGVFTDDTQLTLFTAEGLVDAFSKSPNASNDEILASVHIAYLRWLVTQGVSTPLTDRFVDPTQGLIAEPGMHSRINASFTCLNSLTAAQHIGEFATNDSNGNGAIMRIAPVGLVFSDDPMRAFRLGVDIARLTHGHPTASIAAGAFAMIIAMITSGDTLDFAIENTLDFLQTIPGNEETTQAIIYAPWRAKSKAKAAFRMDGIWKRRSGSTRDCFARRGIDQDDGRSDHPSRQPCR